MGESLLVLHLDDDLTILDHISRALGKTGPATGVTFTTEGFHNPLAFSERLGRDPVPDVVLLDIDLGHELTGRDMLQRVRQALPAVTVLMCSHNDEVGEVAECLRQGADDFIAKGPDVSGLGARLFHTWRLCRLRRGGGEANANPAQIPAPDLPGRTMEDIRNRVPLITASAITTVHVYGESGTGKELVAGLFEQCLPPGTPFVKFNCGSISPALLESELFGHRKGAFTGADRDKTGLIEAADGGWIFLDEVGTLTPQAQVALLRVLENQTIRPVGSSTSRQVNIRVISATNASLPAMVREGSFRQDLWQRLCEKTITLPPLRERPDETEPLIRWFLERMQGGPYRITGPAMDALCRCRWADGNIRELRNTLRGMTEFSMDKELTPLALPVRIWEEIDGSPETVSAELPASPLPADADHLRISWEGDRLPPWDQLSGRLLLEAVRWHSRRRGHLTLRGLSASLGLARSTLSSRLHGLVEAGLISLAELSMLVGVKEREGKKPPRPA